MAPVKRRAYELVAISHAVHHGTGAAAEEFNSNGSMEVEEA